MEAKETVVKRVGFYEIDRTIGRGNFAVVKLARHRITKSQLAIKMIDKKQLDEANLKKVYREVRILKMLDHPNIIKLYQVMETDHFLYLVSEYAPNGELFDYIARNGKMSEPDACKLFWQIVCAVDYCHQKGIVHRDLKAENLLLGLDMNVKIADFGFGNFFKPGEELSTWCGSPPYAAPEVFEGLRYCGPEVDVWSLGVVLYVLVCGAFPFDGENLRVLRDRVVAGRFRIPYFMSSECENLIRKMLVVDPKRRTSIAHIKRHHWVESMQAREDLILRFHNVAINDFKHPQTSEIYDERILIAMENAGIDRQKTIEALEKEDYNNFYAIYNLLLDRLKQQRQHCLKTFSELSHAFPHAYPRRPSTVADQAVVFPGYRAPVLAETKQGPFSQTTDCVQFHEVPNSVCQRQQMIYTDPCGGRPLPFRVGRVVPVGRVFPQVSAGRAIATTSIDEGVEADCDEESDGSKEKVGQVPVASAAGVAEGTDYYLPKADTYGSFGSVDMSNQPCVNTATSFDSNIELDAISNVSSSPSGSITYSAVPTEIADVPECSGDVLEEELSVDCEKNSGLSADFREGRRASDGLVVRGVLEFQQHLRKSMKTRGVVELRKELEKLQSETSRDSDARFLTMPGRFVDVKNTQQRSLEENVSSVQGSSLVVKRTSLPFVDRGALVLQKRLKYGLHIGVCYEPVHSAAFAPNSDATRGCQQGFSPHSSNLRSFKSHPPQVRPYTASPNRQMWQLQTSLKRAAQQVQRQDVGDDGSTSQFRQFQSHFSQRSENSSVVKTAENTHCLRSPSPSFLHGDVPTRAQLLGGDFFPVASSHLSEPTPLVPTCRSQGNLAEYGLCVDSLQAGDSASVGTLLNHPTSCGGVIATVITTDTQEPGAKCHLARRTMFRLLQQQAHVSSCGEDVGEPNPGVSDSRVDDSTIASTSMDVP